MFGNNILSGAMDNPTRYTKGRKTLKGGNPDKGIFNKKRKKSTAPKIKVRKAR